MTREDLTAYDVAGRYDDAYFEDLATRYRTRSRFARRRVANVMSLAPPLDGRRVLDVGSGMGTFAIEAARAGALGVGLDRAPAAIEAAKRVGAAERVTALFLRGDAAELPLREASFDVAVAADLTEHLDDVTLGRVLREVRRVLRPGGTLVVYTPNPAHLFERLREWGILRDADPSHIGLRTEHELVDAITAAGLGISRVESLPSHVPAWCWLERALARWVPLLRRRIGLVAKEVSA